MKQENNHHHNLFTLAAEFIKIFEKLGLSSSSKGSFIASIAVSYFALSAEIFINSQARL